MSRQIRATTVVSHPDRLATSAVSDRCSRSHASCTASSASARDPSIRYATAVRCARSAENRRAIPSTVSGGTSSPGG
jgi:hypothetical protein